jgi:curved DNA-binding protein
MPALDYYQLLGLTSDADLEALKRAYRELARRYHPDLNPQVPSGEQFKQIKEAYDVLLDPERRRAYDAVMSGSYLIDSGFGFDHSAPPDDDVRHQDDDLGAAHAEVTLAFEQALKGGHTYVANGDGELIRVTIPRGCRDGTTVRVVGRGRTDSTGEGADLYVHFKVRPHPRFRRDRNHLHIIETISAVEAMLGTTRSIRNPYGKSIRISIPGGTQPGHRFRIREQGVQTASEIGDLFVEVDVEVPRELTAEQREELLQTVKKLGLL